MYNIVKVGPNCYTVDLYRDMILDDSISGFYTMGAAIDFCCLHQNREFATGETLALLDY